MEVETLDIRELLSACWHLAEVAGTIATEVINTGDLQVSQKEGPEDLVTIADLRIQSVVVAALVQQWPSLFIVGEESVEPASESVVHLETSRVQKYLEKASGVLEKVRYPVGEITVYVDPIDGTKEITRGIYSHVTILIGIAWNSEPLAGVVYQPWYCEGPDAALRPQKLANSSPRMFWGIAGYGIAGLEDKPRPSRSLEELVATDSHSRPSRYLSKLHPKSVISQGGCGSKCALVVTGDADVYLIGTYTKKWDTCAPHALIRSIGGNITDLEGRSIQYHRGVDLANPACVVAVQHHAEILKLLHL